MLDGRRNILLKNGTAVALGNRGVALLSALLAAGGKAVSKDDLLQAAWQTTAIEESNLSVQIASLRKALGRRKDGGEWIVTVQRFGYQFVDAELSTPSAAVAPEPPETPLLAVLPFANLSSDPEQQFFADGLAEDLITELSKIRGLRVIARHSSFAYRNTPSGSGDIAKALGVQFVVEGSVRRSSDRVRINVQLVNMRENAAIWADKFDGGLEDVFKLQDEVVAKISSALSGLLPVQGRSVSRRAPNLEAYDLFVRGRLMSLQSPEDNLAARPLLERACKLDEGFAEAHAWLAMNLNFGWMYCNEADCRPRVQMLAEKAVALDPGNADAHVVLGYVRVFNGAAELDLGRQEFTQALAINPSHADAWIFSADLDVLEGQPQRALQSAQRAFGLNPHPPPYYYWLLSWILYAGRQYQQIVDMAERDKPEAIGFKRNHAAALAQLGRANEAKAAAQEFLKLVPNFTIGSWISTLPFRRPEDARHFIEGYRKAGFPD